MRGINAKVAINISINYFKEKQKFLKSRSEDYEFSAKLRTQMSDGYDFLA